ncbi:MAG: hypothetical protein K9M96_01850 [Deltaproteobacteria bacterium]|nr:hypothetical protein [Deltaproteobacteria bacterium]
MNFTTTHILKALKINRNTFQDWLDRGLVEPSIQKSGKQGEPNLFSDDDFYGIAAFQNMVSQLSYNRKKAASLVFKLRENVGGIRKFSPSIKGMADISFAVFRIWTSESGVFIRVATTVNRDIDDLTGPGATFLRNIIRPSSNNIAPVKNRPPDEVIILNMAKIVDEATAQMKMVVADY